MKDTIEGLEIIVGNIVAKAAAEPSGSFEKIQLTRAALGGRRMITHLQNYLQGNPAYEGSDVG